VSQGNNNSYGRILKTSTLLGGSSAINVALGIVRTKVVALQLGPAIFGVMNLYTSLTAMITSVSLLGLDRSAVREVAEAAGSGDAGRVGQTILVLRRVVWVTGLLGLLVTVAFAWPASYWTFSNPEHAWVIAVLSVTVLFTQLQAGQMALLQGLRKIRDVAAVQVIGGLWSTLLAIPILLYWREKGIAPFLVAVAAGQVATSWWYARRVPIERVSVSWGQAWVCSRQMLTFGLALVIAGTANSLSVYLIRLIIQKGVGAAGVGLYQSAFTISNVYVGFILQAMAGDYYPRLAAVGQDVTRQNQLVGEQAEMAMLLAVPGLVAAMVFSEPLLWLLYSSRFEGASSVLRWQVLGLLGRIISWPLGYVLLARGDKIAFMGSEVAAAALHIGLVWMGVHWYGVAGAGAAFAGLYVACGTWVYLIVRWRHGYSCRRSTRNLLLVGTALVGVGFATTFLPHPAWRLGAGALLLLGAGVVCLRGMRERLGPERMARAWRRIRTRLGFTRTCEEV
jgi:antigen flippase